MPTAPTREPSGHRLVEHVGECRLEVWGPTLDSIFAEGARFVAAQCGEPNGRLAVEWQHVELRARDRAALLVAWLNELIGRSEMGSQAIADLRRVQVTDTHLSAEVRGRAVEHYVSPLKAATYHGLDVVPTPDGFHATVLFDV